MKLPLCKVTKVLFYIFMIYTIGIVISFFLSILLFTKKNKTEADFILAFWLLITGADLLLNYLFLSDKYLEFPYFLGVEAPMPLFQGPLLFLYTAALTHTQFPKYSKWLHFVIPVFWYVFFANFLSMPINYKIKVCQEFGAGHENLTKYTHWAIRVSGVIYVAASLYLLKNYQQKIKNQYSYTEKINLNWLLYLVIAIAFIWLAIIFTNDHLIYRLIAINVCIIGFFGIKYLGIFTNKQPYENRAAIILDKSEDIQPYKKYEKSGLSEENAQKIHEQLCDIMQREQLYKKPELTLSDLSNSLKVHPNNLSQVINKFENMNFYDYINSLRVAEFKCIVALPENQKYTLLALAFEVGFNSKSTFNRNFKKTTGVSPSEYLQQSNIMLKTES
jgi:AraC-like DNA-binding protein